MDLRASIEALRADADIWANVGAVTSRAASAVDGLDLDESQLSWASNPTGLLVTYREIQAKAARLLREGTTNLNNLSRTLDQVATAYEDNDQTAAKRFDGIWEPK
ncbi:hypothetical protein [Plantactinospora sonchi]|uniref:ESX-1 secretion-associated protein n=1 Tax=Plantactinospora sonchi TaxID=1544735 RepID=A0ABU7RZ64_9ACTN